MKHSTKEFRTMIPQVGLGFSLQHQLSSSYKYCHLHWQDGGVGCCSSDSKWLLSFWWTMCRRRSSLLLGKCCQLVAPRTSPIISAAQAVIMLYTCQPFYASTSILSSLLLCLRSSPRLTLPSSSDSTVVCPYHPLELVFSARQEEWLLRQEINLVQPKVAFES